MRSCLSLDPASDDPNPLLAVGKVVSSAALIVGSGVAVFVLGGRQSPPEHGLKLGSTYLRRSLVGAGAW